MGTKRFRPEDQPSIGELRRRVDAGRMTCGICQQEPGVAVLSVEFQERGKVKIKAICVCDNCYDDARAELAEAIGKHALPEEMRASIEDQESRWFGYDASIGEEFYAVPPEHGIVCMAWLVTADALFEERILDGRRFQVNDWAVSTGEHENTVVHGPFATLKEAIAFGRSEAGAVRFLQGVDW